MPYRLDLSRVLVSLLEPLLPTKSALVVVYVHRVSSEVLDAEHDEACIVMFRIISYFDFARKMCSTRDAPWLAK